MPIRSRPAASLAALVLVALAGAGCASAAPLVTPSPVAVAPAPELTPVPAAVTPVPGGVVPPSGVPGAGLEPTDGEAMLLGGIRLDLQGACGPVRDELPAGAVGEVGCIPVVNQASYVAVDIFDAQETMLQAYSERLSAEGIEPLTNDGSCFEVEMAEGPWLPTQNPAAMAERHACWIDADGVPHYVATQPPYVLFAVTGTRGTVLSEVYRYGWLGNEDQPGAPTVWREIAVDAEK